MARRHWLDPLARKVLQAMGDLPKDTVRMETSHWPEAEPEVAASWCIDVNRATAERRTWLWSVEVRVAEVFSTASQT